MIKISIHRTGEPRMSFIDEDFLVKLDGQGAGINIVAYSQRAFAGSPLLPMYDSFVNPNDMEKITLYISRDGQAVKEIGTLVVTDGKPKWERPTLLNKAFMYLLRRLGQ